MFINKKEHCGLELMNVFGFWYLVFVLKEQLFFKYLETTYYFPFMSEIMINLMGFFHKNNLLKNHLKV
jgi:hypothetical protein